jgi:hypothetical protein
VSAIFSHSWDRAQLLVVFFHEKAGITDRIWDIAGLLT